MAAPESPTIQQQNVITFSGVNLRRERLDLDDHELSKSLNADLHIHPGTIVLRLGRTKQFNQALADKVVRKVARINGNRYRVAGQSIYVETATTYAYTTSGDLEGLTKDNILPLSGFGITFAPTLSTDPVGVFTWEKQHIDGNTSLQEANIIGTRPWEITYGATTVPPLTIPTVVNPTAPLSIDFETDIKGFRPLNDNTIWAFFADTNLMVKSDGTNTVQWGIDLISTLPPQIANSSQPGSPMAPGKYKGSVTQIRWTNETIAKVAAEGNGLDTAQITV